MPKQKSSGKLPTFANALNNPSSSLSSPGGARKNTGPTSPDTLDDPSPSLSFPNKDQARRAAQREDQKQAISQLNEHQARLMWIDEGKSCIHTAPIAKDRGMTPPKPTWSTARQIRDKRSRTTDSDEDASTSKARKMSKKTTAETPARNRPIPHEASKVNKSSSHRIFHQLQRLYDFECTYEKFIALCAYVSTILRDEYSAPVETWDAFVYMHCQFPLRSLMEEESTKAEAHVRSYHSWFQDQSVPLGSDIRVLSSASLQDIALENPYSFLKTQIRLEAIASRVDERRLHGVRPTGRPDVTMR